MATSRYNICQVYFGLFMFKVLVVKQQTAQEVTTWISGFITQILARLNGMLVF